MILWIRNLVAYLVCAIASVATTRWVESSVVNDMLIPNLMAIVVALLAINVQTTAVIAVKLKELADKHCYDFVRAIRQFRLAIYEQAGLVALSLTILTLSKAKAASNGSLVIEIAAFFVIYASLHIFLDTTNALLSALFPEKEEVK